MTSKEQLAFADIDALRMLIGPRGAHLRKLGQEMGVRIDQRGNRITIEGAGAAVRAAKRALEQIYLVAQGGASIEASDVVRAARWNHRSEDARADALPSEGIVLPGRNRTIIPKTENQRAYLRAMRQHNLVFGVGPAGTGKTYLAMAMAVASLLDRRVRRIILTRPAVEAGENLGFLPGTLAEKVSPYLRPLYDALHDLMDFEEAQRLMAGDVVEVAPLAFMRGRTLREAFVILDEAQNTSHDQMKMFLTRLGEHSQAVVTGDLTQVDLPRPDQSGLVHALGVLDGVEGISAVHFTAGDVLRHELVQRIVRAYERDQAAKRARPRESDHGE